MDGTRFEKELTECAEELERMSERSKRLSGRICRLLEEYDGEYEEIEWSCRTMNSDIDDVVSDVRRRLGRYQSGDRREVPSVLLLALDCCERLSDTAVLISEGRENERRDLRGQLTSNIAYLAHHINTMKEDGYVPDDAEIFAELGKICGMILSGNAETENLKKFVCESLESVYGYLTDLRKNQFWDSKQS